MEVEPTDRPMQFTGERYTPEHHGAIYYEHVHRYRSVMRAATRVDVLDMASGEGYGSKMLSTVARSVVGLDVDEGAVIHARRRYATDQWKEPQGNLVYVHGKAHDTGLDKDQFDLVVSFETLEHLVEHDAMMNEIKRVMRPDGSLIISSPNKAVYSDRDGMQNPHHLRELYLAEFESLLKRHFRYVRMYAQTLLSVSAIVPVYRDSNQEQIDWLAPRNLEKRASLLPDEKYYIAHAFDDQIAEDHYFGSTFFDPLHTLHGA